MNEVYIQRTVNHNILYTVYIQKPGRNKVHLKYYLRNDTPKTEYPNQKAHAQSQCYWA